MQKDDLYLATIHSIFNRMDEISIQCKNRFPLFRIGAEEIWKVSNRGSWLGGFWAALWWRRAAFTCNAKDYMQAEFWSTRLQPMLHEPSINRSFIFWYGSGMGDFDFLGEKSPHLLAKKAAKAISADFDESLRAWPVGIGMGGGLTGNRRLNVDALAPTLALLNGYFDSNGVSQAHQHLKTCISKLSTDNGAWNSNATINSDGKSWQIDLNIWPRGQAWGMLGMAEALRLYGEQYEENVLKAFDYWRKNFWPKYNESYSNQKEETQDLSAQIISTVAMLKIFDILSDKNEIHEQAHAQLDWLLLTNNAVKNGKFVGQLYKITPEKELMVESACATFFLLEALLIALKNFDVKPLKS